MFCPKCGAASSEQDRFCQYCGSKLSEKYMQPRASLAPGNNISIIFLTLGVSIALVICVISIALYGRVYFFDGFEITAIAWILAIVSVAIGTCAFVKEVAVTGFSTFFNEAKSRFFIALVLIAVIPAIFIFSAPTLSASKGGNSYGGSYYSGGGSYGGGSTPACGHASCAENGPFYCMGKNDTCPNKTYCAYDYYCSQCD